MTPVHAQIIADTMLSMVIARHLMPRARKGVNDNER